MSDLPPRDPMPHPPAAAVTVEPSATPGFGTSDGRIMSLARNWWAFLLRGLMALLFGVIALLLPGPTLVSLALLLAAYLLVDGTFALIAGVRAIAKHQRWGHFILEGVAGLMAGVLAIMMPGATILALILIVAFWAILTGVLELMAARRVGPGGGRAWLLVGGVLSIILGVLMVVVPPAGGYAIVFLVGTYAFAWGILLVAWGFQLRRLHIRLERSSEVGALGSPNPAG